MLHFKSVVAAAAASSIFIAGSAGATDGYFLTGYGIKSKAEGGVGIALPQDALTIATNPAGLDDVRDSADFGVEIFRPSRSAEIVQQGQGSSFDGNGVKDFYIPEIGYNHRLSPRFAFGVALYGNGGLDTDYQSNPFARFGAQGTAGVDLTQAFLSPAIAFKINESNTLGLAVNLAYQRFSAKGIALFENFSESPGNVSNNGNDDTTGVGARLGWLGHVNEYVTLGATWQSKTHMGRFRKYRGLFADQGAFDIPETYGLGIAFRPVKAWTVALDWQRILYSGVPTVGNDVNSLFAGVPLGASNGPGFGWRNVSVVKLGGSYEVNDVVSLRAGVSRSTQPVQGSQTFFNILAPGVVQTHLTVGGTWTLNAKNEINAGFIHAFKKTVDGSDSIPPSFGGGEANVSLEENSLSIGYAHYFQ